MAFVHLLQFCFFCWFVFVSFFDLFYLESKNTIKFYFFLLRVLFGLFLFLFFILYSQSRPAGEQISGRRRR